MEEIQTNQNEQPDIAEVLAGVAADMIAHGHTPYVFTNDSTNPVPVYLLNTFFKGIIENRVGIAVRKDSKTGNEELLLVGIVGKSEDGDSLDITPLAVIIAEADSTRFLPPDGNGGYLNDAQG